MDDYMTFPDTVEEFMEMYKIVDTEEIYTNRAELIPIFRMKQWFEHLPSAQPERKKGTWRHYEGMLTCSVCGAEFYDAIMEYLGDDVPKFCPDCGSNMRGDNDG